MTLSSAEGTESGTTAISITEVISTSNILKINAYATTPTLPTFSADLSEWDNYTEGADYTTTDGYYVVVCECVADGRAIAGGSVVADVKA